MPVHLSDVLDAQVTITTAVPVGDQVLNVRWRPGGLTGETEDLVESLTPPDAAGSVEERGRADRRQNRTLRRILSDLIAGWDMVDAKGKELPVAETLARLPGPFLWSLFNALSGDVAPKEASEPPSSDT